MNKRGISAVVATVLIILITVAGVTIVWTGIFPIISRLQEVNTNVDLQLVTNEGYTIWDADNRLASVQVKRGTDKSDIIGFDLIFVLSGNSVKYFIGEVPEINSQNVYYINLSNYSGELEMIKLAPIFKGGIIGDVVSEVKIEKIATTNLQEFIDSAEINVDDFSVPNGGFDGGDSAGDSANDWSEVSDFQINILPTPQLVMHNNQNLSINDSWQIIYNPNLEYIANALNVFNNSIYTNLNLDLEVKSKNDFISDYLDISNREHSNIFLMLYDDPLIESYFLSQNSQMFNYSKHIGDKGFNQGYLLFNYRGSVYILANSSQGVYYGMQSFNQIIENQGNSISGFSIIDWPDLEYRIFYFVGHENENDVGDSFLGLQYLEKIAKYKMNGVQFSSGSMLSHMDNLFIPYANYSIKNFIRPILAQSWPRNMENGTEGFYVENESFTFDGDDVAVSDNLGNDTLLNLDFEDGNIGDVPDNWFVNKNDLENGEWLITNQEHYSGSNSLMLSRNSSSGAAQPMIYQEGEIIPNSYHLARFKVKTEGSSGTGHYQFILYNRDTEGNYLFYNENMYVPVDDGEWHTIDIHIPKHSNAGKLLLWIRPRNIYGTIYVDDIKLYRMNSELGNVLLQGEHVFRVTNQFGNVEYDKDIDYFITKTGPDLTQKSHIQNLTNKVTIERIPSGSIDAGENVLVSYDYIFYQDKSTPHNINPFVNYTYDGIKDYLVRLADEFNDNGISLDEFDVFLGQDEIRGFNMDSRSIQFNKENYEVMAMNFNNLYDLTKEVFPDSKVFFWADMINLHHNGGDENYQIRWGGKSGATYQASYLINKSIILIPWQYSVNDIIKDSIYFFNELVGIKIAGGAGANIDNIKYWSAALNNSNNYFFGHSIFGTGLTKEDSITYFANYSWNTYKGDIE